MALRGQHPHNHSKHQPMLATIQWRGCDLFSAQMLSPQCNGTSLQLLLFDCFDLLLVCVTVIIGGTETTDNSKAYKTWRQLAIKDPHLWTTHVERQCQQQIKRQKISPLLCRHRETSSKVIHSLKWRICTTIPPELHQFGQRFPEHLTMEGQHFAADMDEGCWSASIQQKRNLIKFTFAFCTEHFAFNGRTQRVPESRESRSSTKSYGFKNCISDRPSGMSLDKLLIVVINIIVWYHFVIAKVPKKQEKLDVTYVLPGGEGMKAAATMEIPNRQYRTFPHAGQTFIENMMSSRRPRSPINWEPDSNSSRQSTRRWNLEITCVYDAYFVRIVDSR